MLQTLTEDHLSNVLVLMFFNGLLFFNLIFSLSSSLCLALSFFLGVVDGRRSVGHESCWWAKRRIPLRSVFCFNLP